MPSPLSALPEPLILTRVSSSPDEVLILPSLSLPDHGQYQDLLWRMAGALNLPSEDAKDPRTSSWTFFNQWDLHTSHSPFTERFSNLPRRYGIPQHLVPRTQMGRTMLFRPCQGHRLSIHTPTTELSHGPIGNQKSLTFQNHSSRLNSQKT